MNKIGVRKIIAQLCYKGACISLVKKGHFTPIQYREKKRNERI